jgi:mannose-6-phosphate isomerase-like protein (cupin superfamily)
LHGDDAVALGPGEFFSAPHGTRHGFRSANGEPARVLNLHAPDAGFAAGIRHAAS